ncbi:MAG: flippase-like domain-containing protein [Bacteroidales bacterium]|nr:flippase-like domain-containing protein [Bacteroidales bacterium]
MVYLFLFFELSQNHQNIWQEISSGMNKITPTYFWLAFILMPFNWLIESIKWQFLIKKIENIGLIKAYQAVLAGTAISIFTPNRIGDYLGRIFILEKGDRLDGTVATIVGNLSQLLVTIIMGSLAIFYYLNDIIMYFLPNYINFSIYLKFIIIIINISVLYIYFQFPKIEQKLNKKFELHKYPIIRHLNLLSELTIKELSITLAYSFLRFLIYSTQFYLLFLTFNIQMNLIDGMLIVFLIFFAFTIVPSIAVAELGIRGIITIFIFNTLWTSQINNGNTETILISISSLLWLINIAIPSIVGTLFILKLRFLRKSDEIYFNNKTIYKQ